MESVDDDMLAYLEGEMQCYVRRKNAQPGNDVRGDKKSSRRAQVFAENKVGGN